MTPITKLDIKAMKQANAVCFRTVKKADKEETINTVECHKEKSKDNPFESTHIFNVDCKNKPLKRDSLYCFEHFSLYDFNFCPLKTIITLLREGDTIQLVWDKDAGSTEDLKKNDFVSDHLYLEVIRKDEVKYNFLLSVSTGRNNSGRMIKNYR